MKEFFIMFNSTSGKNMRDIAYGFKKIFVKQFIIFYIMLIVLIGYIINLALNHANLNNVEINKEKFIIFSCPNEKIIALLNDDSASMDIIKMNSSGQLLFASKNEMPYFLSENGAVSAFDITKKEFKKVFTLDFKPLYAAVGHDNNLYVSNPDSSYIYSYSLGSGQMVKKFKQSALRQLFTIGWRSKKLAGYNNESDSVDIINLENNTLMKNFDEIKNAEKLVTYPLENKIAALTRGNKLFIINLDIMAVEKTVSLGKDVIDFALNKNKLLHDMIYIIDKSVKKLYAINSGKIVDQKNLNGEPFLINLSPEGYYAYIYYKNPSKLEKINIADLKTIKTYPLKNIRAEQMIVVDKP